MKVILRLFLPLCIFSFIAFGISTAVLGVNPDFSFPELYETSVEGSTTTLEGEFDRIKVDVPACKMLIKPHSENYAKVTVNGNNYGKLNANISGDTLKIYTDWGGSPLDWLERLFKGDLFQSTDVMVTVLVPDKEYEELKVGVGAGTAICEDVAARNVELDLSAGDLKYTQPGFEAENVDIHVSAGNLYAFNVKTREYRIDVSAGAAYVYGLTGSGKIDVSAGSAEAQFDQLNGDMEIDVSAGEAVVGLPIDASALIDCDKSAGDIIINVCHSHNNHDEEHRHGWSSDDQYAEDGEKIYIREGRYLIDAHVSAGDIKIIDADRFQPQGDVIYAVVDTGIPTATSMSAASEQYPVEVSADDINQAVKVEPVEEVTEN